MKKINGWIFIKEWMTIQNPWNRGNFAALTLNWLVLIVYFFVKPCLDTFKAIAMDQAFLFHWMELLSSFSLQGLDFIKLKMSNTNTNTNSKMATLYSYTELWHCVQNLTNLATRMMTKQVEQSCIAVRPGFDWSLSAKVALTHSAPGFLWKRRWWRR